MRGYRDGGGWRGQRRGAKGMELKGGGLLCKPLASLYGVWIPKWKHTAGNPSAGFSQRRRAAAGEGEAHLAPPLSLNPTPTTPPPPPPTLAGGTAG